MCEHAGHEVARHRRQPVGAAPDRASPAGPPRRWKLKWMWTPLPVPFGSRIGAKMARWPRLKRRGARHLAQLDRVVGRLHPETRRDSHLVLARAVFGQEGIRLDPRPAHRGDQHLAEDALPPIGVEAIGRARQLLDAGIDELVLEGGVELQAGRLLRAPPSRGAGTRAGSIPRRAVGLADVAQEKMLGRAAVAEIDVHLGRRIRHEDQVAGRAEGRVGDRPERRDHRVGRHPADAA